MFRPTEIVHVAVIAAAVLAGPSEARDAGERSDRQRTLVAFAAFAAQSDTALLAVGREPSGRNASPRSAPDPSGVPAPLQGLKGRNI